MAEQAKKTQATVSVKLPKAIMKLARHAAIEAEMSVSDLLTQIIMEAYKQRDGGGA